MITAITAHQFHLTEALRTYVQQKLIHSIRPTVDNDATHLEVTLSTQHTAKADDTMVCNIRLAVPGIAPIVVHKMARDMYAAIDKAHDTLLPLVHTLNSRTHDLHHARIEAQKYRAEVARQVLTTRDDVASP